MDSRKKARVIAFYLPQYYPIPENDLWWGKGFTEWTNVGKAKPLFKGHYQPRVPADLGYYDLRMPEVREAQARMAQDAGIEGFMYWHYWFGNEKRLLERPFNEVLESGKPDFPFCLGWANHSWYAKNWNALNSKKDKLLIEQLYPNKTDFENHFISLLPAFEDNRYLKVNSKPLFLIYDPVNIPEAFFEIWQNLAIKYGLAGIHFVAHTYSVNLENYKTLLKKGFDCICRNGLDNAKNKLKGKYFNKINYLKITKILRENYNLFPLNKYEYSQIAKYLIDPKIDSLKNVYPVILSNFDHSPRSGKNGLILHNSTPGLFKQHLDIALSTIKEKPLENRIVFLRSWNEWAEGNYVEPDLKFGDEYLQALKKSIY